MQLAALQASLDVYFDERARAQLCDTTHGRHSCGLILMRPPRPGCSQTLCLCNADTVTMAYRFGFGAKPKALQRWWSVNKVAREAKLKAAHTPLEGCGGSLIAHAGSLSRSGGLALDDARRRDDDDGRHWGRASASPAA